MLILTGEISGGLYGGVLSVIDAVSAVVSRVYYCPFRYFTGISCAGCGLTRAWLSLLHGNVAMAFYYHPLFWVVPVAVLIFLFRKKIPRNVKRVLPWAAIVLFLAVYVIRMADPSDTVVVFEPQNGLFFRILFPAG